MTRNKAFLSQLVALRVSWLVLYAESVALVLTAQPNLTDDLLQLRHGLEQVHACDFRRK